MKKQEASEKEGRLKTQFQLAEKKLDSLSEKMRLSNTQVSNGQKIVQYQELKELTPQLTKELIKWIVVGADGSIRIEWNFYDELADLFDFGQAVSNGQAV